ncbi:MAG: substrate-binding domain-containing protein, partial [Pseudomonadota bacterium]
ARIVADFDMLESDARNLKSANEAYLRVGLSPASQEGLYNRAIANLLKANPEICVSVQGMPDERGVRLLKRGDLDLLFAPYDMLEHEKEFATERISQIKVGPFCRKGHPILSIKNPSADDMSAYKVIANIGIGYARKVAEVLIPRHVDQHRQMHIIDNFSIVAETVLATNAIGIISLDYARSQTFKEQFTLLTPELVQPIELGVARLSRWLPSPAVRACVESVKHELHKAEV